MGKTMGILFSHLYKDFQKIEAFSVSSHTHTQIDPEQLPSTTFKHGATEIYYIYPEGLKITANMHPVAPQNKLLNKLTQNFLEFK